MSTPMTPAQLTEIRAGKADRDEGLNWDPWAAADDVDDPEVDRLRAWAAGVEQALGDAWDDGNAVGLDGWVGPGRGTEPDKYAIHARDRYITKAMAALTGDGVQT